MTPSVAMPESRIVRIPDLDAGDLMVGDFVHDDLVPFVVARFEAAPDHVVAVVGKLASNTDMSVRYLATTKLDVSRLVRTTPPPAPTIRRRHLSLCPPVEGGTR